LKIDGTNTISGSPEIVYRLLTDPTVLARCIPGCEKLDPNGDNVYTTTLKVGVGTIKGNYTAKITLEDVRPPTHFKMVVEGKGTTGFVKGSGIIDLEPQNTGTATQVKYDGDVQVGGTIASVGQRMLQGASKMMASQFFTAINAEAQAVVKAEADQKPVEPPSHGFFAPPCDGSQG
jgi:carbon monoxide dehydrogenase subunit G